MSQLMHLQMRNKFIAI